MKRFLFYLLSAVFTLVSITPVLAQNNTVIRQNANSTDIQVDANQFLSSTSKKQEGNRHLLTANLTPSTIPWGLMMWSRSMSCAIRNSATNILLMRKARSNTSLWGTWLSRE